jgi:ribonuclease D
MREGVMTTEIRTFIVPDAADDESNDIVSSFLRTVEVERIDTAYADGAWRVLVLYQDPKSKEESRQIESAIVGALNVWRDRVAARGGISRDAVLPDDILQEIARYAPTTERELSVIIGSRNVDLGHHGAEIVQVVRQMLEDLIA